MLSSPAKNYAKIRLEDWGRSESRDEIYNKLRYKCWLGKMVSAITPSKSCSHNEEECEQMEKIISAINKEAPRIALIATAVYVFNVPKDIIAKTEGCSVQAVYNGLNRLYEMVNKKLIEM